MPDSRSLRHPVDPAPAPRLPGPAYEGFVLSAEVSEALTTGEPIVGVALRFNADFLARCVSTVDMEGPLRISLRPLNQRTPHQGFTAIKHAGTTVLVQPQRSM